MGEGARGRIVVREVEEDNAGGLEGGVTRGGRA